MVFELGLFGWLMESLPGVGLLNELQVVHDTGIIPCESKLTGKVISHDGVFPVNFSSVVGQSVLKDCLFVIETPCASATDVSSEHGGFQSGILDPVLQNRQSHQCTECRRCFVSDYCLVRHMISHTGERPFGCSFEGCSRTFNRRDVSLRHYYTHFRKNDYKCPCCGKYFSRADNLKRHMKRKHPDISVIGCGV